MNDRDIVTVVVITLLAIFLIPALTMGGMMGPSMMGGLGGFGFLFLVVLIVLVYYLLTSREGEEDEEEALEILKQSYVRGELSSEEYLEIKEKLKN